MSKKDFLLLAIAVIIIFARYISLTSQYKDGQTVNITGQVLQQPKAIYETQFISLNGYKVVLLGSKPQVSYGDKVELTGIYKDGQIYATKFNVDTTNFFLFKLRANLLEFFRKNMPEPNASLVIGMVLGVKNHSDREFLNKLRSTGTTHVVVASGMNVVLISFFFLEICLLFIHRRRALTVAILGIWFYVAIAGFEAPLVRAATMTTLTLGAATAGKIAHTLRVLTITGVVMLIINPLWLTDLGFQLSFLATLGLVFFESKVSKSIQRIPQIFRSSLSTSLSAQIGVAPLLLITFGFISLSGLLVNPLVLWTVPYITIGGMVSGLVGIVSEPLGRLVLILVYPFTWWFTFIINTFSS